MTLLLSLAVAGPWIAGPGHGYAKLGGSRFVATDFDQPGVGTLPADYVGWTSALTVQAGLFPGGQLELSAPWVAGRTEDGLQEYRSSGPGDLRVGLGLDLPRIEWPASLTLAARVPLYEQSAVPAGYPLLGDENVDLDLLVSLGHSLALGPGWAWAAAEVGWRQRLGWAPSGHRSPLDLVGGLPYRLQVGWGPQRGWGQLTASGHLNAVASDDSRTWHQLGAGVALPLPRGLHLELGGGWVYAAHASSRGWSLEAGLSYKR